MKRAFTASFTVVLCMILLVSCYKKEDFDRGMFASDAFKYDVALPLLEAELRMENFLDLKGGGVLQPDENGLLQIIYSLKTPLEFSILNQVNMPKVCSFVKQTPSISYRRLVDTVLQISTYDSTAINIKPDGVASLKIYNVYLKSMNLLFSVTNNFSDEVDFVFTFPNMFDQYSTPITIRERVEAQTTKTVTAAMDDVRISFGKGEPFLYRKVDATLVLKSDTSDRQQYRGNLTMNGSLNDMDLKKVDGYMGKAVFKELEGNMSVAGLGLERMQDITFDTAYIVTDIKMENLSAPILLKSSQARIQRADGSSSDAYNIIEQNFMAPYASADAWPLEKEATSEVGVHDLKIDRPTGISFNVTGEFNPEEDTSLRHAFANGSKMKLNLSCRVPLYFAASNYTLEDTMPMAFDGVGENTEINFFELRTIFINGFPLWFDLDLTFLDREYQPLFTLFTDRKIEAGSTVDGEHVETPAVMVFDDALRADQVEKVKQSAYVAIKARISTYNHEKVKIYMPSKNESFFNIKAGFRVKVNQQLEGLL